MSEIYYFMASVSKEEQVLMLILENSPLKHWHFEEIVKQAKVTRAVANKWLKKYQEEGLIRKIKEKQRFPYFTAGSNNLVYQSRKRQYGIDSLYQSGLISHLLGLKDAKTVIVFGSIARGDWYKDSDIDIFIFGNAEGIDKYTYEIKLQKGIELHVFPSREDIKEVRSGLIKNVVNGHIVKGGIEDFAEVS